MIYSLTTVINVVKVEINHLTEGENKVIRIYTKDDTGQQANLSLVLAPNCEITTAPTTLVQEELTA